MSNMLYFVLLHALLNTCTSFLEHTRLLALNYKVSASSQQQAVLFGSKMQDFLLSSAVKKDEVKIEIVSSSSSSEYIVKATESVKKGDLLCSLPLGLAIDAGRAKATGVFETKIASSQLRTGDLGILALLLLEEKAKGSASKYSAYVEALPKQAPGILGWLAEEVNELCASTSRRIRSQIDAVDKDWSTISGLLPSNKVTQEAFRWAFGIVKARHLIIDDSPMLVPGIDSIAFDPLASNEPFTASAGMWGGKIIKVNAARALNKGDVVTMSFGLKSSAECIEDHGFIPDIDLVDSCAEFAVSINEASGDKYFEDKQDILLGAPSTQRFDLEADESVSIDPSLLQFLRLKFIEGKDSFILESCFRNTAFYTLAKPFSKQNEIKAAQYLQDECERMLETMNAIASDAQDADTEKTSSNNNKKTLATLRRQERAALLNTSNAIKAYLKVLLVGPDPTEYYQERRLRELDLLRPLDESEIVGADEGRGGRSDEY